MKLFDGSFLPDISDKVNGPGDPGHDRKSGIHGNHLADQFRGLDFAGDRNRLPRRGFGRLKMHGRWRRHRVGEGERRRINGAEIKRLVKIRGRCIIDDLGPCIERWGRRWHG